MEDTSMVYTGLKLPINIYLALVEQAGGKRKGRDGKMSAIIRDYITRGLENDGVKVDSKEDKK